MNRSSARRPRSGLHCREAVARSSRSPIGDCYDCAMCESFVRDLKRPGFARCGHLRGRVSQGPMEGRKRKTRVALPSRNGGNDQPSTESGQLHLSSRRQRCDDPLNPPSTRRSRSGCGVARPESSRRWDRWATATTMQCVRASSPRSSASCSIASASAPRARRGSRSSTSSRASTILDGGTRLSLADRVRACAGSLSRASPGSTPCGAESRNNFRKEIRDNQS